jgi:hypothetical protein
LHCIVCKEKKPLLAGCKCDATSFFTACSKDACHKVVTHLIHTLEQRGATGILISREEQRRDRIQKTTHFDHTKFRLITFDDVRTALTWASMDVLIEVAGEIFEQLGGLAQGNPLSPVLARCYLDSRHQVLYRTPRQIPSIVPYTHLLGQNVATWMATACHVDDSLWISRQLCCRCIFRVVAAVWPEDVGLTLESDTETTTFLHCDVSFAEGLCSIWPRVANRAYALGKDWKPCTSAYPLFNRSYLLRAHLRPILGAKLHLLLRGIQPAHWLEYADRAIATAMEPLHALWPALWVADILCGVSYTNNRVGSRFNRFAGAWLRKHAALYPEALRSLHLHGGDGLGRFYDKWMECLRKFRP